MTNTAAADFTRYAARANDMLVQAGVTTPDAPIVWVREDGAVMINQILYKPAALNADAARAIAEPLHEQHGAESRIGNLAAAWYDEIRRGAALWTPALGQQIANDAYTLASLLVRAEEA